MKAGIILRVLAILIGLGLSIGGYLWIVTAHEQALEEAGFPLETHGATPVVPPQAEPTIWKPVLLFTLMLAGIVANQIYEQIKTLQTSRRKLSLGQVLAGIGGSHRFWMAVCVSPLVFFATYTYVLQLPDDTVAAFYAFQNGFFWEAVFAGFKKD